MDNTLKLKPLPVITTLGITEKRPLEIAEQRFIKILLTQSNDDTVLLQKKHFRPTMSLELPE